MNAAAAVAASGSNTAAVAICRSRVHSLDKTARSLLRTASAPGNALYILSPAPAAAFTSTTGAAAVTTGASGMGLARCRSLASVPTQCAAGTHSAAVAAASKYYGRGFGANNEGASAGGAGQGRVVVAVATAAGLAIAAARGSGQSKGGLDGEGGGVVNSSRAWCRESEPERSPFAAGSSNIEDNFSVGVINNREYVGRSSSETCSISRSNSSKSNGGGNNQFLGLDLEQLNLQEQAGTQQPKALRITDVYRFEGGGRLVGRGHRSTVSSATHRRTGQPVAVKRISRAVTSRGEVLEEVHMLKLAGAHPNVVTMQAFFEDTEAYYIVMDLCQGGELYHRLADKGRYSEGQAARIMAEVAEAVGYLHNKGIIHFDLKPENIMLAVGDDCVPEVRLADFGSAFRQHRPLSSAKNCTIAYSAPEVLAHQDVDEKVDMWALGVVMWVLLTGRHPFDTDVELSEGEVARRVVNDEPDLRSRGIRHVSPEGKDLVRRLLAKDPEDRPSARQMLSHPWLRAVRSRAKMPLRQARGAPASPATTAAATTTTVAEAAAGAAAAAVASVTGGGALSA